MLIGSDENELDMNDVFGILASWIFVPFRPPSAELAALIDVVWMFYKEYTVVHTVWRGGMVQSEGDV